MPSPTHTGAVGTRPEQPSGTAHLHMDSAPSPTGSPAPQPQTPPGASTHGHQPAASRAAAKQVHPAPRPRHGTPDRPTEGPAYAPPEDPSTQARAAALTDTTSTRPSDTVHPHAHNPTQGSNPQAPAASSRAAPGDQPPTAQAEPASQRRHAHQPGRRYGPQNHHIPVARPPTRTQVQTRHTPPSRLTPCGPQPREAGPGRRPFRKATPERRRGRRTTQPRRPHRQPGNFARSPRFTRRKSGDLHSGQQQRHQQGNLAADWTSQQYSMPTHLAWRHTEAARHRPLANLVRNLKNQCRTPGMRPASTHHQPMRHNPQVARTPPPCQPGALRRRKSAGGGAATGPTCNPRPVRGPGKPHLIRPNARPAGKGRPASTTATWTL